MLEKSTATDGKSRTQRDLKAVMFVAVLVIAAVTAMIVVDSEQSDATNPTISINKTSATIYTNQSPQFVEVAVTINGDIASTDKIIAEVPTASSDVVYADASSISDKKSTVTISAYNKSGTAEVSIKLVDKDGTLLNNQTKKVTVTVRVGVTDVKIVDSAGKDIPSTGLTVNTNKEVTVKAKITPSNAYNDKVTWKSDNESVAKVEGGVIKAIKEGTAKITATSEMNTSKSNTITVKVQDVHVTGITVDPTKKELDIGDKFTITATITPADATNKNVTISVDKTSLISYGTPKYSDNKVTIEVTAIGTVSGDAKLTVTTVDGSKTADCTISVKRVDVTGVEITNKKDTELEVGETLTLIAKVKPDKATVKTVSWISSNPNIATIDDKGTVTAKDPGVTTIKVTTTEGNFSDTCEVTVLRTQTIEAELETDSSGKAVVKDSAQLITKIKQISATGLYPVVDVLTLTHSSVYLSSELVQAIKEAQGGSLSLEFFVDAVVYFDENAVDKIDNSGKLVGISLVSIPSTDYPKFGDCYIYELKMMKDDEDRPTTFGGTGPEIILPHIIKEGEDVTKLQVAYVYGDGDALLMRDYKFVSDDTEIKVGTIGAVDFKVTKTSKFMYLLHDCEYISKGGYNMVFVALFGVIVAALCGGVGFLVFNPKASATFMGLFERDGNRSPRRPRFPRRPKNQNQFDNFGGNNYY